MTTYWKKTDNSGMLYPLITTLSAQSNYEICVFLTDAVDKNKLQVALERAYDRFSCNKVELQNNLFRACFVENNRPVVIHENNGKIVGRINFEKNNNYLIEVSIKDNEVHFKFFHALSDGNGAMCFINAVITEYAKESGAVIEKDYFPKKEGENENAYKKYLDKSISKKGLISAMSASALQVKGKFFKRDGLGFILGEAPVSDVLALSRKYGCSLTVLLGAVAMLTVNEIYGDGKKAPSLFIPVNLRKYFETNTLSNFVSSAKCVLPPDIDNLEETIKLLSTALENELKEENLKKAILLASTVDTNPFVKYFPLFLKRMFIKLGRELVTTGTQTMILSNLGKITFPNEVMPFVKDIKFYLNCNRRTPVNFTVSSFNGTLTVCFTRHLVEKRIEKTFFEKMRKLGVDFEISSNYREDEYGL